MKDQQTEQRLTRLLSFLEQDPDNPALLFDIAALHLTLDQVDAAHASALRALELAPDKAQPYAVLGLVAMRQRNHSEAATRLGKAIELGDTSPSVLYHHAYSLTLLGQFTEAEASAAAAAQFHEIFPHAPALYLRTLHYLDKIEEAIAFGESLAAGGVAAPKVQGMLSTLYMDAEDVDKARAAAAAALELDSDDSDAHTTIGVLALGDLDGALAQAEFERVLKVQAQHGRAMLGVGLSRMLAGDLTGATAALNQTTQSTNMRDHVGTWHTLAWCHILQKNIDAAEQALQHALELDRNFAETHGGLAIVALMRGNIDSAVQAAKRASALDRNNFSGNFAQSLIQQIRGNAQQARSIVEHLLTQPVLPGGKTVQQAVAEMLAKGEGRKKM